MEKLDLKFKILSNGVITKVEGLEQGSEEVYLHIETNHNNINKVSKIKFYHRQDCCESVSLYEYHGSIEVGDRLIEIKINTEDGNNDWGTSTWTFVTIETSTSTLTLRFLGESNGYYSEEVDIDFIDLPEGIINVDGTDYASFDGMVKESISSRKMFGIKIIEVKDMGAWGEPKTSYVVSNGVLNAHGYSIESALSDLRYKYKKVDLSGYSNLTLDSELTYDESITLYREVTGACDSGTMEFLRNAKGITRDKKYSIREIIRLTENRYGNKEFKNHFYKGR